MTWLRPAGALAILAVPVLVALWRAERRRTLPVSTLLFWRRLPAAPRRARRLPLDPLFLLELLLVLALAVGFTRPALEHEAGGDALVLVLDVSASMGARETGGTRFTLARRRARALVAEGADEVLLVVAAERPRVALRWTDDEARILASLETLEPLDVASDLAPALALGLAEARARPGARIAVFTDLPRDAGGLAPDDLAAVDWVQIGRTDDNVAVASLVVDAPAFRDGGGATATVVVQNHGAHARHTTLVATVGDVPWEQRDVALDGRAAETIVLARPPATGALSVALESGDALAADDVARGWIPARAPRHVVVVSAAPTLGRVLAAIPDIRVDTVPPAAWAAPDDAIVVFDGVAPPSAVRSALYVAPPAGAELCPSDGEVTGATVVDWEDDHPALAMRSGLGATPIARARRLATPAWATPVVVASAAGRAFPLLVAGERDGRRIVCFAAPLDESLGTSDGVPLLVLALGALAWVADAGAPLVVDTGVAFPAPAAVDAPGLRAAGGVAVAERAGTYQVGDRLVIANLLDARESDIGREGGGEWRATKRVNSVADPGSARDLGGWLYAAALPLFAIEWIVWSRRRA
jgi:hypothetical protein